VENKLNDESSEKPTVDSAAEQVLSAGKAAVEKAQEAVERAQSEGGKIIESLSREGEKVRTQTQRMADETVEEVRGRMEELRGRVEEAKNMAADTLENLERVFEERIAQVLSRLGIPTKDEFQEISRRLQVLNDSVQELIKTHKPDEEIASPDSPDELKAISGLGPALESKLRAAGITSYRQIAELSPADVDRVETDVINSAGRIMRENWIGQAKELHFKKYGERI